MTIMWFRLFNGYMRRIDGIPPDAMHGVIAVMRATGWEFVQNGSSPLP